MSVPPSAAAAPATGAAAGGVRAGGQGRVDGGDDAGSIEAFWRRPGRTLRFPLQRPALLGNAAAAALFGAGAIVIYPMAAATPVRAALLLCLLWAAAVLVLARFLVRVIEHTASGYLDARAYPAPRAGTDWQRVARHLALLAGVPLLLAVLGRLHVSGLLLLVPALVFSLWLPAVLMLLATNDNLSAALDPRRAVGIVRLFGLHYLLLGLAPLLLCLLVEGAAAWLAGLVPSPAVAAAPVGGVLQEAAVPAQSASPVLFAFMAVLLAAGANTVLLCMAVQLGLAMYQRSGALGIAVVGPGAARVRGATSSAAHERRLREAVIARLVAAGEFREAVGLIGEDLRERPNDLSLHVRLHAVLLQEGAAPRIEEHADRFLVLLLAAGNTAQALELYEQTRARSPGFAPRDPDRLPLLARAAVEALKPELAAELIRGFDRKYPGHPCTAEVYVLGARIMLLAGDSAQARRLLEHVTTSYPDGASAAEARRYLARFA